MSDAVDAIRRETTVDVSPSRAFALFTEDLGAWWPRDYTWGQQALQRIAIEPRDGGRCFEEGPHGFHSDWGRVLACQPPNRLVLTWQIAPDRVPVPDPDRASEVEVNFSPKGDGGTRVELEHRGFERHGDGGAGYRDGMDSPQGWTLLLERFAAAAAQ